MHLGSAITWTHRNSQHQPADRQKDQIILPTSKCALTILPEVLEILYRYLIRASFKLILRHS
jgi:hypothetical protein